MDKYEDPIKEVIKKWKDEAGIKEPILFEYDYAKNKLVIHTTKPGLFIGYKGELIKKYESLLAPDLRSRFSHYRIADEIHWISFRECDGVVL